MNPAATLRHRQAAKRRVRQAFQVAREVSLRDGLRFAGVAHANGAFRDSWLPFLEQFARDNGLPPVGADLLLKPLNQYLLVNLPISERIRLLQAHYATLTNVLGPTKVASIWSGGLADIGAISGKRGRYELFLCDTVRYCTRKEGELTIAIREGAGGSVLSKLTFLLASTHSGRRGMMIGGLQGLRSEAAKQMMISATRDLFGLRPRDAVLNAALAIAHRIGVNEVWAISSELHVHNARGRRHQKRLLVDYDEVWVERGAQRAWPFGWILKVPAAPIQSGRTVSGRRRDSIKEAIWALTQSAFTVERQDTAGNTASVAHQAGTLVGSRPLQWA